MTTDMNLSSEKVDDQAAKRLADEGALLVSENGSFDGRVYYIAFGHRRHVPTMQWIVDRGIDPNTIRRVADDYLMSFEFGPAVPTQGFESQFENPDMNLAFDQMRQVICSPLRGSGYEFGAGPRPLVVPVEARVSYVDRFNYEQTADGSYVQFCGKFDNFVSIDLFDSFDEMNHIGENSADFLIGSHVIEHVRDPFGVIVKAYSRLRRGGHLVLMVPDQKRTFDLPRTTTTLDHLIADHFCPDRNRDLEHYIEYHRLVLNTPAYETEAAADLKRNRDLHYHTFTFESFGKIIDYLHAQTPWSKVWSYPAQNSEGAVEFYWLCQK